MVRNQSIAIWIISRASTIADKNNSQQDNEAKYDSGDNTLAASSVSWFCTQK